MNDIKQVIIIGSGPAAHTAAIYSARSELDTLMFEGFMAGGIAAGGQLTTTSLVENFPGFSEGIDGPQLMVKMREQSIKQGTEILTETVDKIDLQSHPFSVHTASGEYKAHAIIIATGATAKRLGIKGEDLFWDKGISACAICDGALPIFRDNPLIVIGGGDAACEEAEFLTKFGSKVYLVVRRDELRASKVLRARILKNSKIQILWNTEAVEAKGTKFLESVQVINNHTKKEESIEVSGLFYAIGHSPNTTFLDKQIELDDVGYVITKGKSSNTSKEGVFACGDVQDPHYRQAISAAGSGCMAGLDTERWLVAQEK